MPLETRSLSPSLGVEITGLDLARPFSAETQAEIVALYEQHHLLLFRNQSIEEDDQVRLAELFGPLSRRSPAMKKANSAFVSNNRPGGVLGDGELYFHSDNTFFDVPLKAISLYAIEVPDEGGDTLFSNCALVYEALSEDMKRRLEGLTSYQLFDYFGDYSQRSREETAGPDAPRAVHPLVWTDPESGRKVLFLSEHTTVRINEIDEPEGEALIAELRGWIADPRFVYRHKWREGDLVLWDNVVLQHARQPFDPAKHRTLRRTPIGDPKGRERFPFSRTVEGPPEQERRAS